MTNATGDYGVGAAWTEAEAALPEDWYIRSLILTSPYRGPIWEAVAANERRMRLGRGSTPSDALRALARTFADPDPDR